MKNKLLILAILSAFLLLQSCLANWHVQKAVKKDPTLLQKDTITFMDSVHVITKEVRTDSTFIVSKDTVTIIKDNLTMRHYYHNDSVWIYGECAADTVIHWKFHKVPYENIVINDPLVPRWMWVLFVIGIVLLIIKKILRL